MVIVRLSGGLGNQLFQYACGKKISVDNNLELRLDVETGFRKDYYEREYVLNKFNIIENLVSKNDLPFLFFDHSEAPTIFGKAKRIVNAIIEKINPNIITENKYDKNIAFSNISTNYYIIGSWQNEKYFKSIRSCLLNEFTLKSGLNGISETISEKINKHNSIAVHYRKYGGKNNKYYFQRPDIHGVLSESYYRDAIKSMLQRVEDPHFFIFSDDPKWVNNIFSFNIPHTIVYHNNEKTNYEDLWLMSLCKHNIIANSTFSWWGAWLNNNDKKIIIAPKKWFNSSYQVKNDIIPDSWIQI